jgi:hypothetical protein
MWKWSTACVGVGLIAMLSGAQSATAVTMRECSAKYKAAQNAGTLGGSTWQEFRKANCGPGASPAATGSKGNRPLALSPSATFPQAISPKYSNEPAGKARLHTCLDQYRANKTANANAGLRWIAKGGGYYSECNKRLKG